MGRRDDGEVDGVPEEERSMGNPVVRVLFGLLMVALVVTVDLLVFRDKQWFWERLAANVGIVLVFGAFYFRFAVRS